MFLLENWRTTRDLGTTVDYPLTALARTTGLARARMIGDDNREQEGRVTRCSFYTRWVRDLTWNSSDTSVLLTQGMVCHTKNPLTMTVAG